MGLLKNNTKKTERFKNKVFILNEPNEVQKDEIANIIKAQSKISNDSVEVEMDLRLIRYLLRELTNIGCEVDEYSDEELSTMLDDANKELKGLIRNITDLIEEIVEDIMYSQLEEIKKINSVLDLINTSDDMNKLEKKFNKISKKYKLGMTFAELITGIENEQDKKEVINKIIKEMK